MEFIHRHIEDIIIKTNSTFKGVLLTGARQTGKSTLFQELFPEKRYVPIDDPFIEAQANENPNEFMMLNPPPAQRRRRFRYILYPMYPLPASSCIPEQNAISCVNVFSEGSPSRILIVRLISFGITTRPRSSIRLTIPVAFIFLFSPISKLFAAYCCR